jgi:hypothetical protein
MAGLSYLIRRGGVLHFRAAVPPDLQGRIGRRELRVSLGTGRMREARDKVFALAAFVRGLINHLRAGLMSDLTPELIFDLTRREFRRILEEDRRARLQRPGKYFFGVPLLANGVFPEDWLSPAPGYPWDLLMAVHVKRTVDQLIRDGKWPDLKHPVMAMLKRFGIEIASDDPVVNEVCHQYAKDARVALSAITRRENGDPEYTPVEFLDHIHDHNQDNHGPWQETVQSKRKVSDLIREYSEEKKQYGWTERSERTIMERLGSIVELMGDVDLVSVDHDFAFKFRKKLLSRPKKKQSTAAKASGKPDMLSVGTVNNITSDIAAMFKYAKRRGWVAENYFAELSLQDKTPAHKKRQQFTREELALLFGPGFLDACKDISWRFWVPILGLFTGARLDEIAQAFVDDVREVDGVWCLVVESSDEKSVKTISGNRSIPLHPCLIHDLKFLAFVEGMRAKGEKELFPGLKRVQGRKGHYMTRWFGEYRSALGIPDTRTFHSLRKNFSNCLAMHDVPPNMIKRLDGHSLAGDITEHHYIKDIPVTKLIEYIEKLDFGIDLSHLAQSRFVVR